MTFETKKIILGSGLSAFAVSAVLAVSSWTGAIDLGVTAALAQNSGGSGSQGGQGQGGSGSQSGQGNQGGQGAGQGGPSAESDGKGPQAGGPSTTGSGGGKPVWAQEGIPEVELGRLSVARSPDQVLQRAYDEALATLSPEMVSFYSLSLDEMIFEMSTNWDSITIIDSPLQNLSLFQDALDGTSVLTSTGEITNSTETLMATFLGVASDKNLPITVDTVTAVTTILGAPLSPARAASLAADAEAIRIAVVARHG